MNIPTYSQSGQPWSSKLIGNSGLSVGGWGCYGTSLTMIIRNYGYNLDPGEVFDRLNANNGFTSGGLMTYDGVERTFPTLHFHKRAYTVLDPSANFGRMTVEKAIADVKKLVARGMAPILCVDNMYNDKRPDHAVVCYDAPDNLSMWKIKDPDGGRDILFESKYGPIAENLYGYVSILGPPKTVPDGQDVTVGTSAWKAAEMRRAYRRNEMWKVDTYAREIIDTLL